MLLRIQMYHKKYKFPCSAVNVHVTIRFVYFISCKTSNNFRFDGRHCIGDLMAHTIIRKLCSCTLNLTDKVLSKCKPKFQRKTSNFSDKTNHKNSIFFLLVFFIGVFLFPIDIFVNSKIEIPLKSHYVVKLPVDER